MSRAQSSRITLVAAPGVVDENVELPAFVAHALEEFFDLIGFAVVAAKGNTMSAPAGHFFGRIIDGARHIVRCRTTSPAAPRDINGGAKFSENCSDSTTNSAARTSH